MTKLEPFSNKHSRLLFTITLILTFLLLLKPTRDGDFGWHLKTGEYIVNSLQIPTTDLFSHTLPNHSYVFHSWLNEVLIYFSYSNLGLIGPSLLIASISTLAIFTLITPHLKPKLTISTILTLLLLLIPIDLLTNISIRTQAFTFFGLALLTTLTHNSFSTITKPFFSWVKHTKLWLLPLIFIIWTNMHGGFTLGLLFYLLIILTHLLTHNLNHFKLHLRTTYKFHTIILIISTLTTLINPYNIKSHLLSINMISNKTSLANNLDWIPYFKSPYLITKLTFFSVIISFLLLVKNKHLSDQQRLLFTTTFLLTLISPRFSLLFIATLIPLIPLLGSQIHNSLTTTKLPDKFLNPLIPLSATILIFATTTSNISVIHCTTTSPACYAKAKEPFINFPYQAVEFLKSNPQPNNLLNDFNWGGYLAQNLPDTKLYAVGYMDQFTTPQGRLFLDEYLNLILFEPGWQQILKKYHINTILLPPKTPLIKHLQPQPNWHISYSDSTAVILTKAND